jgi:hypothetical protein
MSGDICFTRYRYDLCASVGLVLTTMTANQTGEQIIIVGTDLIPSEADEIELKVQYTVQYRMV